MIRNNRHQTAQSVVTSLPTPSFTSSVSSGTTVSTDVARVIGTKKLLVPIYTRISYSVPESGGLTASHTAIHFPTASGGSGKMPLVTGTGSYTFCESAYSTTYHWAGTAATSILQGPTTHASECLGCTWNGVFTTFAPESTSQSVLSGATLVVLPQLRFILSAVLVGYMVL